MDHFGQFSPRPSDPILVIESESPVKIPNTRQAIRSVLAHFYGPGTAIMMLQALNFNFFFSQDRRRRAILITSDDSTTGDTILLDLFARLYRQNGEIRVNGLVCTVTLHGHFDQNRLNVLAQHYFWLSSAFNAPEDQRGQRYLMN